MDVLIGCGCRKLTEVNRMEKTGYLIVLIMRQLL